MYDTERLEEPPQRTAVSKLAYGQTLKFATLNVNSIWKAGMHKQVEEYMEKRGVSILCLQETKVARTTQYVVGDLLYVLHGGGGDQQEHAGVGFVFSRAVRNLITGFELDETGRMATVGIDTAPRRLTLITVYMPQSNRPDLERALVYEAWDKQVAKAAKKGPVVTLGDFNARIHGRLMGEEDIIGPHTWGLGVGRLEVPEGLYNRELTNRELLLTVCEGADLRVMNTWFQKTPERKVTYMSPGVETLPKPGQAWDALEFAELDLCVVQSRWKGAVRDVQSVTWAGLNTDHFPLEVELCVKLAAGRKVGTRVPGYDFANLPEDKIEEFNRAIADRVMGAEEPPGAGNIDTHWGVLCEAVQGAMQACIPPAPVKPKRPWISTTTLEMIQHRMCLAEVGLIKDARAMDKLIRSNARSDKKRWIEEGLSIKFWDPIKGLVRKPAPRIVALKREGLDKEKEWGVPAEVYADYLEQEQWGRETEEQGPDKGWGTGPLGKDTGLLVESGPITDHELGVALKALSKKKTPGPDGIPNEAWMALRGAKKELLDFLNRCWDEESFPAKWREAEVVAIFKKGSAVDPANYRPISLLQTAYKIMGKILTRRLETGLEGKLRETQFGFRKGRSTSEPLFIIRRLQDLVHAKKNHALHLIFLDWSKAFDKVDTGCLPTVLRRMGVPEKVIRVVVDLVRDPEFRVKLGEGEKSGPKKQGTGIRQGCTLSPFLFTLILTAIMQDVEGRLREEHPLATTPAMPILDLEYADDTALIAKTAEIAEKLLRYTQEEAAKYGLQINRDKTFRLAYNSEEEITYTDGTKVPRVEALKYLGSTVSDIGHTEVDVREKMKKALARCKALRPVWAASNLTSTQAIRVLNSCVFSALLYGLHTLYLTEGLEKRLDALQIRCLRRALGIRSTYASKLIGEEAVTNQQVAHRAGAKPLSAELNKLRYKLLGHVLRRSGEDPLRATTYDRFGQPKAIGGTRRQSKMRKSWAHEVIQSAAHVLGEQGALVPDRGVFHSGPGHPYAKVSWLAQDRQAWSDWISRWYENTGWWDFASTAEDGEAGELHRRGQRPQSPARARGFPRRSAGAEGGGTSPC